MKYGIQLARNKVIQTILYADDQIITAKCEDELQNANLGSVEYEAGVLNSSSSMFGRDAHVRIITEKTCRQKSVHLYMGGNAHSICNNRENTVQSQILHILFP
jgi:hypothetical protein